MQEGYGMVEGVLDGRRAGDRKIDLAEFFGDGVIVLGAGRRHGPQGRCDENHNGENLLHFEHGSLRC